MANGTSAMRTIARITVVIALCNSAACTDDATRAARPSGPTRSEHGPAPPGKRTLDCADPIGTAPPPTSPYAGFLDVVGLNLTSKLQAAPATGTAPHRLFAKTGLFVRAGREATLTVPPSWANRVSMKWGNHAPEWATELHVPACPAPEADSGTWLVFPGGYSLDEPACVPLQIRTENKATTVHVPVAAPCPN